KLQKYFRQKNRRRMFVYWTFAILIYLLIKNERKIRQIIIDTEYIGQDALIKGLLTNLIHIDKKTIMFKSIGKKSPAHDLAIKAYRIKRADIRVTAQDIINVLTTKKPGVL
ncbi:MAG: hypothetical protein CEN91_561, partial [Candidatus Berkelbacteria bacterium Licking1014_85]